MEKFIPFEKMSRKEQKKINAAKRGSWNGVHPATRVADTDARKYKRKPKYPEQY